MSDCFMLDHRLKNYNFHVKEALNTFIYSLEKYVTRTFCLHALQSCSILITSNLTSNNFRSNTITFKGYSSDTHTHTHIYIIIYIPVSLFRIF